jgi:hypothetical protein
MADSNSYCFMEREVVPLAASTAATTSPLYMFSTTNLAMI